MTKPFLFTLVCMLFIAGALPAAEGWSVSFELGRDLLDEGDLANASIEFQRAALEAPEKGADLWMYAAYAAIVDANTRRAERLLTQAEKAAGRADGDLVLLYAESAARKGDLESELYFLDLFTEQEVGAPKLSTYVDMRRATTLFRLGRPERAIDRLHELDGTAGKISAVEAYMQGSDKNSRLGGTLGLVPGAGYWYSGEVANGFRSLILNAVFISAMVYAGEEEQWGAFTLLTFFEITWYSGSIYGGIDAAHRYNRDRFDRCADELSPSPLELDASLPMPTFGFKVQL